VSILPQVRSTSADIHSARSLLCYLSLPIRTPLSFLGLCKPVITVIGSSLTGQYRPPQSLSHWLYRHGQCPTHLAARGQIAIHPGCKSSCSWRDQLRSELMYQSRNHNVHMSFPPRSKKSEGSVPSHTIVTPTQGDQPRTGPIMLSTFDEEDGPGMQLQDLGQPIDLEQKDRLESEADEISNYKVEHMA
jgi:hypothetical protein